MNFTYLQLLRLLFWINFLHIVISRTESKEFQVEKLSEKSFKYITPVNIEDLLPEDYDPNSPPQKDDGPIQVNISINILSIRKVDDSNSQLTTDIFFHEQWLDERLTYPLSEPERVVISAEFKNKLWMPRIYFKNSFSGTIHNVVNPEMYLSVYRNKTVFLAVRLTVTLGCKLNMRAYPHDVQICLIMISSLQWTTDTIHLNLVKYELSKAIMLAHFDVMLAKIGNCTKGFEIGAFSCVYGSMLLNRRLQYFVIASYLPTSLVVITSFVGFWLPPEAYPARCAIPMTALLSLLTQLYQTSLPAVSYIMAINIWMSGCVAFIFLGIIEYAIVVTVMDNKRHRTKISNNSEDVEVFRGYMSHENIDKYSRIIFPSCYALFVFVYYITVAH